MANRLNSKQACLSLCALIYLMTLMSILMYFVYGNHGFFGKVSIITQNNIPCPVSGWTINTYQNKKMEFLIEWSIHQTSFCFGNLNSKTAIISLGDITESVLSDLTELSRLNKGNYALKYNYIYCEFPANVAIGRNPVYSKAPLILNALKLYSYVIWMDFDVVAHTNSRSFDTLLEIFKQDSSIHAVITTDYDAKTGEIIHVNNFKGTTEDTIKQPPESEPPELMRINTGIQLYRSCDWTFTFIEEWHSYFNKSDDQQSMHWHWYEHRKEWDKHIKIVRWDDIQIMGKKDINVISKSKYKKDNHLWHLAGGKWTWEKKQHRMKALILNRMNKSVLTKYQHYKQHKNQ